MIYFYLWRNTFLPFRFLFPPSLPSPSSVLNIFFVSPVRCSTLCIESIFCSFVSLFWVRCLRNGWAWQSQFYFDAIFSNLRVCHKLSNNQVSHDTKMVIKIMVAALKASFICWTFSIIPHFFNDFIPFSFLTFFSFHFIVSVRVHNAATPNATNSISQKVNVKHFLFAVGLSNHPIEWNRNLDWNGAFFFLLGSIAFDLFFVCFIWMSIKVKVDFLMLVTYFCVRRIPTKWKCEHESVRRNETGIHAGYCISYLI